MRQTSISTAFHLDGNIGARRTEAPDDKRPIRKSGIVQEYGWAADGCK